MTPILYRLAGYSKETLDAHTYFQVVKNRALFNEKGERSISFPLSVKAQEVWNTLAQRLHYMSIGARVVGGITLVAGLWKSVLIRSPLALLGGLVVACTAEFFAQRVNKDKVLTEGRAISIRKIPDAIDDYRNKVMMTGTLDPNLVENDLPTALENIALSLFTDEEIKALWTNHVNKNPGYNISLTVFNELPVRHPMKVAASTCSSFINKVNKNELLEPFVKWSEDMKGIVNFINAFEFTDSPHLALFRQRFETAFSNLACLPNNLNSQALTQLFDGKMVEIATNPTNIPKEINGTKYAPILLELSMKQRLGSVFEGESEEFLEWARLEFNKFPEDTPNKQLYLSCLPTKTVLV